MKRLAVLVAFFVAGCGSIFAQPHTVALAYKAGDTYRYSMHIGIKYTMAAVGMSFPISLDMSAKEAVNVKSVDSAGTADVVVTISGIALKTSFNGTTNTTTTTNTSTLDMKVAKDGHIVSVNGSALTQGSIPGVYGMQGGLVTAILPDHAVKQGDTWTKTFSQENPFGTGSSQVTSNNTYLRDENNDAVIESKIKGTIDMTIDASSMAGQSGTPLVPQAGTSTGVEGITIKGTSTSDLTSWIDLNAMRLVKTHSTGTVNATLTVNMAAASTTPGFSGPVTLKGTQSLDLNPA